MKKIKTGLAAYGSSGKLFHAPFLKAHSGFEISGAWERSSKNIIYDYPEAHSYNSLAELLGSDCELVIINTPVDTHFHFAKQALDAGKHVLVEKAFTTTVQEAQILIELAESKGLKLTIYKNRRYDSDFKTVQKVLQGGVLGDIIDAELRFERFNPSLSPKVWKETDGAGAGVLMDLGPHIIDQAVVLFGYPTKLFATLRKTREGTAVDDYFEIMLFYPKMTVRLKASFLVNEPTPAYVLHGRNGSFLKSRADIQEDELKLGKQPNRENWGTEPLSAQGYLHTGTERKKIRSENGNYLEFYDGVYASLTENTTMPVTGVQALQTMKIIAAARECQRRGEVVIL